VTLTRDGGNPATRLRNNRVISLGIVRGCKSAVKSVNKKLVRDRPCKSNRRLSLNLSDRLMADSALKKSSFLRLEPEKIVPQNARVLRLS